MKKFTVVWTFIGNYQVKQVDAKNADDALDMVVGFYGKEFVDKANVYVFSGPPVLHRQPTDAKWRESA